jgi:hypothetical protein
MESFLFHQIFFGKITVYFFEEKHAWRDVGECRVLGQVLKEKRPALERAGRC